MYLDVTKIYQLAHDLSEGESFCYGDYIFWNV